MWHKQKEVNQTTNQINNSQAEHRRQPIHIPSEHSLQNVRAQMKDTQDPNTEPYMVGFLIDSWVRDSGLSSKWLFYGQWDWNLAVPLERAQTHRGGRVERIVLLGSALVGVDRRRCTHHACPQHTCLCIWFVIWTLRAQRQWQPSCCEHPVLVLFLNLILHWNEPASSEKWPISGLGH